MTCGKTDVNVENVVVKNSSDPLSRFPFDLNFAGQQENIPADELPPKSSFFETCFFLRS